MIPKTEEDFRAHAVAEFPRECCGLVVVVRGRERYIACHNLAEKTNQFVLNPEDWAAAEDLGEVIAICHSHPIVSAKPSEADLVMCEASGLEWHIVHVDAEGTGELHSFVPSGYEAPLVGRAFTHGVLDCYSLVKDYFARVHNIDLPHFEREDNWWQHGQDLYMENFRKAGFEPVTDGSLQIGDGILMSIHAPGNPSPVANHAAIYLGDEIILQHLANRLSSRDHYSGYFQENTRLIVRHKDMK